MKLIDDTGRLFGRVNVYDAAAVALVVLAVAGVGVALLDPFGAEETAPPAESATRYATVDLGDHPAAVAERLSAGDGEDGVTVTDTYVGPGDGDDVRIVARVRLDGTLDDGAFAYGDDALRAGDDFDVETDTDAFEGEVVAIGREREQLQTRTRSVAVESRLPSAALVERNDTARLANRTVATVTNATVEPATDGGDRRALVTLSVRTVRYGGDTYFGAERLLAGQSLTVRTDRYVLSGTVAAVGDGSVLGDPVDRTVVLTLTDVDPEVADGLVPGLTERRGGRPVARLTDVRTEPASVTAVTDDGRLVERDHPRRLDVRLTVDLRARETADGLYFRTRPLREGSSLRFDFGSIAVDGTVVDIEP